jgi:hypothetical protein
VNGRLRPYDPYGGPPGSRGGRDAASGFERGIRSILIRLRRAGITFAALLGGLVVYMIGFGGVGFFTFLLAMFAIMLMSFMVMFFPVRDRSRRARDPTERPVVDAGAAVRLDRLTGQTENWLLERCRALPQEAGPALDRIVDRLRDLQPSLATVPAESQIGGEAQRLIGQHLPSLVDTYLGLPVTERGFHSPTGGRLAESLTIVADQLDDLCERVAEERRMGFETERRFIETRYKDDGRLSLDRPR